MAASPIVTWVAIGDLSEPDLADPDYFLRPPTIEPAIETAAGWVSAAVIVGAVVAFVAGHRFGRLTVRQTLALVPTLLIGAFIGMAGRVLTAGGVGANIGAGLVVMASPFVLAPLAAMASLLAFQRTRPAPSASG